jgi:hypothetical protein
MRIALAAFAASSLLSFSALAADQYTPAQLPPPPAPAPGKAQSAAKPKGQPAPASATTATTTAAPVGSDNPGPSSESAGALDTRWALAAMVGFSTDYLNFGLGVRGGKTFGSGIYVGGSALFHFAGDTYSAYAGPVGNYTSSASVFYFGPEGGYDFDLKAVVLRAYVGLGLAYFSWSVNGGGTTASGSMTRFVVWPGASVLYDFAGSPFFVGGDIRFVSVPGGPAVGFFAFGGVHFGS